MAEALTIVLAQLNPTVGDLDGNATALRKALAEAAGQGADLVVAPELFLAGYPAEDLVMRRSFVDAVRLQAERLAAATNGGPGLLVGAPWRDGERVHNAGLLLEGGRIAAAQYKHDLPNYSVFDEKRVFAPGSLPAPIPFRGIRLGVLVCEDMWTPTATAALKESGAELLIVANASPFDARKPRERTETAAARVRESGLPMVYVNQVGGQDDLVFDGASFALNADGTVAVRLAAFREERAASHWSRDARGWRAATTTIAPRLADDEAVYTALAVGLRDYCRKNGFRSVILGFSGGADSALSAAIAADALGAENVHCVMLPSQFTSQESLDDAAACAAKLGVVYTMIPIEPAVGAFGKMLQPAFANRPADVTEENIQARARAVTLMALSNKFGHLLLSTGNKSEIATGYATLYGDMAGGYSVVKDIYKTTVYKLAAWRNGHRPADARGPAGVVIPVNILTKAPTAELRLNQKDSDTLPPYDVLDDILHGLVEEELPFAAIVGRGHAPAIVAKVERMLYANEYKRRQAAPGVRVSRRYFGRDRRYPLTNHFRETPHER